MDPLQSTLADLTTDKLVNYAKAFLPTKPPVMVQASTDPAVFRTDAYIKALNLQAFEASVYGATDFYGGMRGSNKDALDRFSGACHEAEMHKWPTGVPSLPAFQVVDTNAFDQWWASYSANPGQSAPPLFFIKPAPAIPAVKIVDAETPAPVATDGPVGPAYETAPGIPSKQLFHYVGQPGAYFDGQIYPGATGVYQLHDYSTPMQQRMVWFKLA